MLGIVNVVGSTDRARMRPRHLSACRTRDRRRRDQDLHLHRRRPRAARHSPRPLRDLSTAHGARLLTALEALPEQVERILGAGAAHRRRSRSSSPTRSDAYFVGRAAGFAVAMEGALKLKEISYLHAEAYPASELKHGPLALISPETPTVVVAAARRSVREERVDHRGDSARGAVRSSSSRIRATHCPWPSTGVDRGAEVGTGARSAAAEHSAAAARVSRRARARHATSTSRAISRSRSRSSSTATAEARAAAPAAFLSIHPVPRSFSSPVAPPTLQP